MSVGSIVTRPRPYDTRKFEINSAGEADSAADGLQISTNRSQHEIKRTLENRRLNILPHTGNLMCVGSCAPIWTCPRHVRFAPNSDRIADMSGCPFSANRRHRGSLDHLVGGDQETGWDGDLLSDQFLSERGLPVSLRVSGFRQRAGSQPK